MTPDFSTFSTPHAVNQDRAFDQLRDVAAFHPAQTLAAIDHHALVTHQHPTITAALKAAISGILNNPNEFEKPPNLKIVSVPFNDGLEYGIVECFPPGTLIQLGSFQFTRIEYIDVGSDVCSFSTGRENGDRGAAPLVPRRVTRLFRNVTREWLKVTPAPGHEAAAERGGFTELVVTPGHRVLAQAPFSGVMS